MDSIRKFVEQNKIGLSVLGVAVGVAMYIYKRKDQEVKQKQSDLLEIIEHPNITKGKLNLRELALTIQRKLEEKMKQKQICNAERLLKKNIGMKQYIIAISEGLRQINDAENKIQNEVLESYSLTEEEFQTICHNYPLFLEMLYYAEREVQTGQLLSLEDTKRIVQVEKQFLSKQSLKQELITIAKQLPQQIVLQAAPFMSIILLDEVESKLGFNQYTINRSLTTRQSQIYQFMDEQGMLLSKLITEIISSVMPQSIVQNFESLKSQDLPQSIKNHVGLGAIMGINPSAQTIVHNDQRQQ